MSKIGETLRAIPVVGTMMDINKVINGPGVNPMNVEPDGGISQRDVNKIIVISAGVGILAACAPKATETQVGKATIFPDGTKVATEIPDNFNAQTIDKKYLLKQLNMIDVSLQQNNETPAPRSTASSSGTNSEIQNDTLKQSIIDAGNMFRTDLIDSNNDSLNKNNLLGWLKYAVAQGVRAGWNGDVNYWIPGKDGLKSPFENLAIYREKMTLTPEGVANQYAPNGEYQIKNGKPAGLRLRYGNPGNDTGSGLSIVGINENNTEIVVAFEEYFDRGEPGGSFTPPRMRLAVIPPSELGDLSINFLGNVDYYIDQPDQITFKSAATGIEVSRTVKMNRIKDEVMGAIKRDSGEFWADKLPLTLTPDKTEVATWQYTKNPVVRAPEPEKDIIPKGIDLTKLNYSERIFTHLLGQNDSVKYYATDEKGNLSLVGKYIEYKNEWTWAKPVLEDYSDTSRFILCVAAQSNYYNAPSEPYLKEFKREQPLAFGFDFLYKFDTRVPSAHNETGEKWRDDVKFRGEKMNVMPLVYQLDLPAKISSMSYAESLDFLDRHVRFMVGNYAPDAAEFGVLQEAIWDANDDPTSGGVANFWGFQTECPWNPGGPAVQRDYVITEDKIPEYIKKVYVAARETAPDAVLTYADGGGMGQNTTKSDLVFQLVSYLNRPENAVNGRNLVDKIVFELHGAMDLNKDQLIQQINRYRDIGIKVGIEAEAYYDKKSPVPLDEQMAKSKEYYQTIFSAAKETGWVENVTLWNAEKTTSYHADKANIYMPFSKDPKDTIAPEIYNFMATSLYQSQTT